MHLRKTETGRWKATYRDPAGRQRARTFDRKADGQAWAADREAEVRRGQHADPRLSRQRLRDYAAGWWDNRVVEATTAASDRGRLDNHVLPAWGDTPLERVTTAGVQAWTKRLTRAGMGAWTVRSCHALLSSILEAAVVDGLLPRNRARGVRLPAKPLHREVYLTRAEVDAVAAAMDRRPGAADFDRAVLATLVLTGLRWGELAGLEVGPDGLDMLRRRVHVTRTVVEVNGRFAVKAYPKGRRRRTVPLPEELLYVLAEHLRRHPPAGGELGLLVFRPAALGYRYGRGPALSRHSWPRVAFHPALAAAGLAGRGVTVHDLRHTYASWLAQGGVSGSKIAALIGDTLTTAERYTHLAPDHFGDALAVLSKRQPGVTPVDING